MNSRTGGSADGNSKLAEMVWTWHDIAVIQVWAAVIRKAHSPIG